MEVLPERVRKRRDNFFFYKQKLRDVPGISFINEPEGYISNRWLTTILIEPDKTGGITREDIRLGLEKENIESRPLWKPMHLQPVFKDAPYYGETIAEFLFRDGLCLPSGSNLTSEELERILQSILTIVK